MYEIKLRTRTETDGDLTEGPKVSSFQSMEDHYSQIVLQIKFQSIEDHKCFFSLGYSVTHRLHGPNGVDQKPDPLGIKTMSFWFAQFNCGFNQKEKRQASIAYAIPQLPSPPISTPPLTQRRSIGQNPPIIVTVAPNPPIPRESHQSVRRGAYFPSRYLFGTQSSRFLPSVSMRIIMSTFVFLCDLIFVLN